LHEPPVLPLVVLLVPQASDRSFKSELAKLVDLEVWAQAKEESRRELAGRWAGTCHACHGCSRER
jgi:cytochrome c553